MNVLITGHQGYVGSVLVPFLRSNMPSARLVGLDAGYFANILFGGNPDASADWNIQGDVRRNIGPHFLDGFDAVVHLAAVSNDPMGERFEAATRQANYQATVGLAQLARRAGVRRFVLASSCSVYGAGGDEPRDEFAPLDPLTEYARSKVDAERDILKMADRLFQVYPFRFATAYGASPRHRLDLVVNDFVASAVRTGKVVVRSDGTPWRPVVHVLDMCRAILWALTTTHREYYPVPLNVGEKNFQVKDLAMAVVKQTGAEIQINKDAAPDRRSYRVNFDLFHDMAPGYTPAVSLEQGVADLVSYTKDLLKVPAEYRSDDVFSRLHVLDRLVEQGKLDEELFWKQP